MSGALTHSPSQIVQKLLVDLSLGTLASAGGSWPITCGEEPDEKTGRGSQMFVRTTEGLIQGRSSIDGYVFEKCGIQIMIRDTRYEDGRTKAKDVQVALDAVVLRSIVISSSTYVVTGFHRNGSVIEIGREVGTNRHLFSINGYLPVREN